VSVIRRTHVRRAAGAGRREAGRRGRAGDPREAVVFWGAVPGTSTDRKKEDVCSASSLTLPLRPLP